MRRLLLVLSLVATALGTALGLAPGASAATPLPAVMASTGDSITRAYDATLFGCFLADCPQDSWSTGTSTAVNSHLLQIRALGGRPVVFNDAKSGARMVDLDGQLQAAATQSAQYPGQSMYATVLMGANDLCTPGQITDPGVFQAQFQAAVSSFLTNHPERHVFVSSIPNLVQLYTVLSTNSRAVSTWRSFGICQSVLAPTANRAAVSAVEAADNAALQTVCATFTNCRWDGLATYQTAFTSSDVSTVDYFHPSLAGQKKLAARTFNVTNWAPTA